MVSPSLPSSRGIGPRMLRLLVTTAAFVCILQWALSGPSATAQDIKNDDPPEVAVEQGALRGQWAVGSAGTHVKFAAFRGIPYAAPPLGPLRFKGPRPPASWEGVRDATKEGPMCVQGNPGSHDGLKGSEDCLFVNVYVPADADAVGLDNETTASASLPVLFYVHGGGFIMGSGGAIDLGPELLLQHDIIVVTFNYRLGALGFLNLDTEGVPGNAGLKDALAALRWVHRNIAAFGGDPARVTVTGHSAGAAMAHYLALVPSAAGLARAAILQSGCALSSWAYTEDNLLYTTELAMTIDPDLLIDDLDDDVIEVTLRNATAEQIVNATVEMRNRRPHRVGYGSFSPSPERRNGTISTNATEGAGEGEGETAGEGEDVFLPRDPESLVLHRAVPAIPVLMGLTTQEALVKFCFMKWDLYPEKMEIYNKELHHLLPLNLWPGSDTALMFGVTNISKSFGDGDGDEKAPIFPAEIRDIADQVREEYFGSNDITNSSQEMVELLNDVSFNVDMHRLMTRRVVTGAPPTYLYQFGVEDEYNLVRSRRRLDRPGAVHSDELGYLWRVEGLGQNYSADTPAALTMQRLTTMWANFVKTVNPIPETTDLLPVEWPRTTEDTMPRQTFLDIGEKLELKTESLGGKHMSFWRIVYRNLRNGGGT